MSQTRKPRIRNIPQTTLRRLRSIPTYFFLIWSEKTARNHVSHILEKLGLSRRSEAAAFAVEHKLVPPREQQIDDH
jgi:hypothetical protein